MRSGIRRPELWLMLQPSRFGQPSAEALGRFLSTHGIKMERDPLESVRNLRSALYRLFEYAPGSTTVDSPIDQILETGRGVCQDYAHVMISVLRSWGVPARYVSGYLGPDGHLSSTNESHAWVECWLPGLGWSGFDPANDCGLRRTPCARRGRQGLCGCSAGERRIPRLRRVHAHHSRGGCPARWERGLSAGPIKHELFSLEEDMKLTRSPRTLLSTLALAVIVATAAPVQGQTASLGADMVSRYVWRGADFGESMSVQPALTLGFGGLEVGAWGSYSNLPLGRRRQRKRPVGDVHGCDVQRRLVFVRLHRLLLPRSRGRWFLRDRRTHTGTVRRVQWAGELPHIALRGQDVAERPRQFPVSRSERAGCRASRALT